MWDSTVRQTHPHWTHSRTRMMSPVSKSQYVLRTRLLSLPHVLHSIRPPRRKACEVERKCAAAFVVRKNFVPLLPIFSRTGANMCLCLFSPQLPRVAEQSRQRSHTPPHAIVADILNRLILNINITVKTDLQAHGMKGRAGRKNEDGG